MTIPQLSTSPIRTYRHVFHEASSVFIPGLWHNLQTTNVLITVFVLDENGAYSQLPFHLLEFRITPQTYDIAIDFCHIVLRPDCPEGFVEEWLPPQSGTVLVTDST